MSRDEDFIAERERQLREAMAIRRDTYNEVVRLLRQAESDIIALLQSSPTEYQAFQLPRLLRQIRAALADIGPGASDTLRRAADASWRAGISLVDAPLAAGGVRVAAMLPALSLEQLAAMRNFMTDRIRDIPIKLANEIADHLALTIIGSQSVGDTTATIARLFTTRGRSRALTIVRTELGRVYATATNQRLAQASTILPGLRKQWRRSGKIHSRPEHDGIDGQLRDIGSPFRLTNGIELQHPRDPAAPLSETINCGCEELPHMDHWRTS